MSLMLENFEKTLSKTHLLRVENLLWNKEKTDVLQMKEVVPKNELPLQYRAEEENADSDASSMSEIEQISMRTGYSTNAIFGLTILGFGVFMAGAGRLLKWVEDNDEV